MGYAQQKEQEPVRQQNARIRELQLQGAEEDAANRDAAAKADSAFSSFLSQWDGSKDSLAKTATQIYGERGIEKAGNIWRGFEALQGDPQKKYRDTRTLLKDVMVGMNDLPEDVRASVYPNIRQGLVSGGVITEQDAPPDYDPAWWKSTIKFGEQPAAPVAVEGVGPDGNPQTQFVVPQVGTTVPKPAPKLTLQEQANEALRKGDPNEYNRIMKVIRETSAAGRAPDKPNTDTEWVNRPGPNGAMVATQIPKGTAQPGDVPYSPPRSTSETAQDRQRIGRLESARGFLKRLNELREKINTKMGPEAGLTGMARQARASIGLDPDVAEYERVRAAGGRALAVAIMGAQNLSDADASAWANMLPGARVDAETAKRLTDQVGAMLDQTSGETSDQTLGKPFVGERRMMGDQIGVWDGQGWVAQ